LILFYQNPFFTKRELTPSLKFIPVFNTLKSVFAFPHFAVGRALSKSPIKNGATKVQTFFESPNFCAKKIFYAPACLYFHISQSVPFVKSGCKGKEKISYAPNNFDTFLQYFFYCALFQHFAGVFFLL
jgi:hypothetical protein